jgi:hypothetical protein
VRRGDRRRGRRAGLVEGRRGEEEGDDDGTSGHRPATTGRRWRAFAKWTLGVDVFAVKGLVLVRNLSAGCELNLAPNLSQSECVPEGMIVCLVWCD